MATCPNGHDTQATDYCDTCGAPVATAASGPGASGQTCPHCSAPAPADALFCEQCGYDYTTGALPRTAAPAAEEPNEPGPADPEGPAEPEQPAMFDVPEGAAVAPRAASFVAEVWIDPDWYASQESPDALPSPGLPHVVPLRGRESLIGRRTSGTAAPEIDCDDNGVSRRHARLTTDGDRWFVEDLGSSNGTFVGRLGDALPEDPIGGRTQVHPDERLYLGSWTRIVVREATDEEAEL